MPSSTLGDNRHQPRARAAAEVHVAIEPGSSAVTPTAWGRFATVLTCVLLLGSGIAVGIWAAVNETAAAAR